MAEAAYFLERPADGEWSWTARFRLPEIVERDTVLDIINDRVQCLLKYRFPLEEVAMHGLSGVLLGPDGDNDAQYVQDVVFATDPSRRYGIREAVDVDQQVIGTANRYSWKWVDIDGNDDDEDAVDLIERDLVRVIMGRNLDQYGGKEVATFEEARALLPSDTPFETQGGYLFSGRPGMELYGEAAIVVAMEAARFGANELRQLFQLAAGLNQQDRFVLETPQGAEVYRLRN